jgi:hypothetical protein
VVAVSSFRSALHAKVSLHYCYSSTLEAMQRSLGIFPVIDPFFVRGVIILSPHNVCWTSLTCKHWVPSSQHLKE